MPWDDHAMPWDDRGIPAGRTVSVGGALRAHLGIVRVKAKRATGGQELRSGGEGAHWPMPSDESMFVILFNLFAGMVKQGVCHAPSKD